MLNTGAALDTVALECGCRRRNEWCSGEMLRSLRTPIAKASGESVTDAEARKRGDRTGLDTLVFRAVNDDG